MPSETNSTDYIWQQNKFYSRGTEGFANGITDKNGFNNLKTFEDDIDVLVMGSSHMEAFNVAQDKNTVALLNEKFQDHDMNFYNIGISGHDFVRCLYNLENAIDEFAPQKYVIIETQTIVPSISGMEAALKGNIAPIESHNEGIIGKLQRFPYLRLLYNQIKSVKNANKAKTKATLNTEIKIDTAKLYQLLNAFIHKSAHTCEKNGVKLIIFYNCELNTDAQGDVLARKDVEAVNAFSKICEENDVIFVDMYDSFKTNYLETFKLPRGFSNSEAGVGHLNEEGHRVIAEKISTVINN